MELNNQAEADVQKAGQEAAAGADTSGQDAALETPEAAKAAEVEQEQQNVEPEPENLEPEDPDFNKVNSIDDWHNAVDAATAGEPEAKPEEPEEPGEVEGAETPEEETEETEEVEETEEQEEVSGDSPRSKRYRLRSDDPVELRAMELKSRNRDMSLEEALERAKKELGKDNEASGDEADAEVNAELPDTVEATETEIDRLNKEHTAAMRDDLDFEKADELNAQIRKLERHIGDLKLAKLQEESRQASAFTEKLEASKTKAIELYDFVTKDGPEVARMEEIDRQLKEAGDSLYESPEKPLRIAQMVARELNIAPRGKQVKAPATPASGSPPRKKVPVQPASASKRSQTPENNTGQQLDEQLEKITSPMDWEEMTANL